MVPTNFRQNSVSVSMYNFFLDMYRCFLASNLLQHAVLVFTKKQVWLPRYEEGKTEGDIVMKMWKVEVLIIIMREEEYLNYNAPLHRNAQRTVQKAHII